MIIEIAQNRAADLKERYAAIHAQELESATYNHTAAAQHLAEFKNVSTAFEAYLGMFNLLEDFNTTRYNLAFYKSTFEHFDELLKKSPGYFRPSKFKESEFRFIESDLLAVENMGKLVDNT
jgi:hypothetical protein